jgi:UDP-GlcNAc:undecaprenyl-phosphate GlcNAc-1-phosphate transferase
MRTLLASFLCAFLFALGITPFVRRLALRLGALDPFSARKVLSRSATVPRLGGLGIAAAFYATLLIFWMGQTRVTMTVVQEGAPILALLLGGLPILMLGCVDDLRGMGALTKLTVQVTVSVLLWLAGLRIGGETSLLANVVMPGWASFCVSVLWVVGVINAVNLIDGLDGLASGVAFFALCSTSAIAILRGDLVLALFTITLAGAVLGFLLFNWNPASIFMGDAGSMFLGYLLATTSIWTVQKAATAVLVVFPAVALGLPLLDTSLTIGRRLLSGRPVLLADRDHVHHRLLGRGLTQRQAVILLYAVCAVFSGLSVGMVFTTRSVSRLLLILAALFAVGLAWALGYVRRGPEGIWESMRRRQRNRELLKRLSALGAVLERAREVAELQQIVREFGEALGAVDLRLVVTPEPAAPMPDSEIRLRTGTSYSIRAPDGVLGRIESRIDEMRLSPDDRILLQLLCDLLVPPLRRLSGRRSGRVPSQGITPTAT